MSRPEVASTSTRDTGLPATRKNLRRSDPVTSTTSPSPHAATERRSRPPHTEQSTQSTPGREPSGRGTTTRKDQTVSPLGNTFSSGGLESFPCS